MLKGRPSHNFLLNHEALALEQREKKTEKQLRQLYRFGLIPTYTRTGFSGFVWIPAFAGMTNAPESSIPIGINFSFYGASSKSRGPGSPFFMFPFDFGV